ncbi:hypothetical protein PybrP1_000815, partial [[Pythium] brassicae (nom. inval.)]
MLRTPKASDWAADDDDDAPPPQQQEAVASPAPASVTASSSREPPPQPQARNRWGRTSDAPRSAGYDRGGGGGTHDRSRDERSGGYDRGGGGGGYDRRDDRGGGGGGYDRGYDRGSGGYDRRDDRSGGGSGGYDRRDSRRQPQHVELPKEQGVVIAIKESFGFVSCMDRDGDLFFHITEAPVDVQLHDEVEFRVKFNQRSSREMACQLVALPKGSIVQEDVADEFLDGVVTRALRSAPNYHNASDSRPQTQRDDAAFGLIEVATLPDVAVDAATRESVADSADDSDSATGAAKSAARRNTVRFNADSVAQETTTAAAAAVGDAGDSDNAATAAGDESGRPKPRRKKAAVPHVGDEVRFRVATHRKTGVKRAVELSVTASAKAKLEKEIAAKFATMVRELGVVDRMKAGGGFIKCCDRLEDVYFPLHEIRDEPSSGDAASGDSEPSRKPGAGKKLTLREGDEVSFFVFEEKEDESGRGRARLTALRVQRAPKGSVSFEDPVRSNVDGIVSKSPKEPRNGPEVVGSITPDTESPATASSSSSPALLSENKENAGYDQQEEATGAADDAKPAAAGGDAKKLSNKAKAKAKKLAVSAVASVAFRLSDTHDMSYSPLVGDAVRFDEVLDKRSGKLRAVNVRVVQLNPKNRERGVITSLRDDFGFIKCADRAVDAYFRFADVMAAQRDYRIGTEVAFDVNVDPSKPENVRATRVEVLPKGTVQWEATVEEAVEGEVVVVPSSGRSGLGAAGGSRGSGNAKGALKAAHGRVRFTSSAKRFWLEFFPELKEKIDSKFVAAESEAVAPAPKASDADSDAAKAPDAAEKKRSKELKLLFPASLSKSERFAIHQYCDELGIQHQSSGDGASRRLELLASAKVAAKTAASLAALPALELELKMEDLAEVRYSPQVGDRVQFTLMLATRTKQFLCKSVVCVASVSGVQLSPLLPPSSSSASATTSSSKKGAAAGAPRGEGFIVAVRSEGFGFIQPADAGATSFDENLFFHIKEVTTGETLESLKVGMEVEYTPSFDAAKQKTRALAIKVLPAGTVTKAAPQVLRGVVMRPSLLHPLKAKGRFVKSSKQAATSTVGKIRVALADGGGNAKHDGAPDDDDAEDDTGGDEAEGATDDAAEGDMTTRKPRAKATATRKAPKASATTPLY